MDILEQNPPIQETKHCSYYYMPGVKVDWANSQITIKDKVYDHESHLVNDQLTDIRFEDIPGLNQHMILGLTSLCSFGIINGPELRDIIEEWSMQYSLGSSTPNNISSLINQMTKLEIDIGDFNIADRIDKFLSAGIVSSRILKFIGSMYVEFPQGGLIDIIDSSINLSMVNKLTPDTTWEFLSGLAEVLDSIRMTILANGETLARNRMSRVDLKAQAATRVINKTMHAITNLSVTTDKIWQKTSADIVVMPNFLKSTIEEEIDSGIKSAAIFGTYQIPKAERFRVMIDKNGSQERSVSSISRPDLYSYSSSASDVLTSISTFTRFSKKRIVFRSSFECPAFANAFIEK